MSEFTFELNDKTVSIEAEPDTPLLDVLRNELELNGPKFGCGLAQCGACSVLLNGTSIRACSTPVSAIANQQITSIEGLGDPQNPHPLQSAFIEKQAMQCGYCASGIMITASAFLKNNPSPTTDQIKTALSTHLCRCGAQPRMIEAVALAAESSEVKS